MEIKSKVPALTLKLEKKNKVTAGLERFTLESMTGEFIILLDKYLG